MPRLVAIGDIHCRVGHPRNPARLAALDQIVREGLALPDLGAWLVLGDVFDQRSSIDDRNELAPRFQRMADAAPVVIDYGNHDAPGDLEILARLKAAHPIYVVARPQALTIRLATMQFANIIAFPYPHKHGLVSLGVEGQNVPAAADAALEAIAAPLVAEITGTAPTVLIGHGTIAGAVSSVGQPMGLERDIVFTPGLLARFGSIPKVFGHIHKPQELLDAWYAGSVAPCDFGEVEAKRYLVLNFDRDSWSIESRPIATPKLYHVEGDLSRDAFTWRVTRGPEGEELAPPRWCEACRGTGDGAHHPGEGTLPCGACHGTGGAITWAGAEVRVRYRFNADEKSVIDTARILAEFADCARLELDPIAMRTRQSRAPEVAAARTVEDKARAYLQHIDWTPSLATKLAVLQQPDGATFLDQVATAIKSTTTSVEQMEVVEL